ncbi:MAG: phytoene desaturase [Pseudomonadota bacterium]
MLTKTEFLIADRLKIGAKKHALVIGAGFGGLAAAMRLGAKGYQVTILDRLDVVGGRASSVQMGGHRFDLGPTIVTVPHVFEDLFAATGRKLADYADIRPLDPYYEIRWQDGSQFFASQDLDNIRAQIAKMAPSELAGFEKFLKLSKTRYHFGFENLGRRSLHKLTDFLPTLPKFAALRADRSILTLAKKCFKDPRLQMAFSFHPLFIGGDPNNVTSVYALVSYLEAEYGVHYAMGGAGALANAMAKVIREQGGQIFLDTTVDRIVTKDNRAIGVEISNGEHISADLIVSNADSGHTYQRLLRDLPKKRWSDSKLKSSRWSMGLFVWYFGTKGTRGMWSDVGHHTILNGPRYKGLLEDIFIKGHLADDMSLYIHRPAITDPTVAPEGDDTFYALSPVPHLGHDSPYDWDKLAETYKAKLAKQLDKYVLPGFQNYLTEELIFTPETFRDRYLSPYGSAFSLEPRIFQSAWFRPHNISEDVKGLYLVGAGTHPGAGLPGVVSTAEVMDKLVPHAREWVSNA